MKRGTCCYARLAWPRAIFFTLRFFDPRSQVRLGRGCSALRFLRAARFFFLRSSRFNALVFAIFLVSPLLQDDCRRGRPRPSC